MHVVTIRKNGDFGNQLIQYMVAIAICNKIPNAEIRDFNFPHLDIQHGGDVDSNLFDTIIVVREPADFNLDTIYMKAKAASRSLIIIEGFGQNIRNFLDPGIYRTRFGYKGAQDQFFTDRHLVINVRANEILTGRFNSYCLVPIQFYVMLVAQTGLEPIFIGQIHECEYILALREAFPDAVFMPSQGPRRDFEILQTAKNLVLSVSTFSWAAGFISNASNIFVPLLGFYNPCWFDHVDLLPFNDPRFQYYWFPMMFSLPEKLAIRHHTKIMDRVRKISADQVNHLRLAAPFLKPVQSDVSIDAVWYLHTYLDAACEISEGWFTDVKSHYNVVGRQRGYLPRPPLVLAEASPLANLAIGKPALLSSVDRRFSTRSEADEAARAVDGIVDKPYGFRSAPEDGAWWAVDLELRCRICEVRVYNFNGGWQERCEAAPIAIETSLDGESWSVVMRTTINDVFGADIGPLRWIGEAPIEARHVRIRKIEPTRWGILHLAQVEIYGTTEQDTHR